MVKLVLVLFSLTFLGSNVFASGAKNIVFCDCVEKTLSSVTVGYVGGIYYMDFNKKVSEDGNAKPETFLLKKLVEYSKEELPLSGDPLEYCSQRLAKFAPCQSLRR